MAKQMAQIKDLQAPRSAARVCAVCVLLTPVLLQLQASSVKTNVDAQVCDVWRVTCDV